MTGQDLHDYIAEVDPSMSLADAWDDFGDAYGWDLEDNPYRED